MGLPELTGDISGMAGMSPKNIAAISVLRLYEKYFDYMATSKDINIDRMTAALLICCPEEHTREELWKKYTDERDKQDGNQITASVLAVGGWYQYMSFAMGLTEQSRGGW